MAKCSNCGAELDSGAKFCIECGTKVPQVKLCVQCQMELPINAKFCSECGAPQGGPCSNNGINVNAKMVHGDVIGQKVAGDNVQNKVMGNLINNTFQDETKKVIKCHVCGKHLTNDNAHTCPQCGHVVCEEHFNRQYNCCKKCFKKNRNELIVDISGKGDFTSVSEAVKNAHEGATIIIKPGIYREHFVIDKKIALRGDADSDNAPIIWDDTNVQNSVVTIAAEVEIVNLKIWGQQKAFSSEEQSKILMGTSPDNQTPDEYWPKCIYVKSSCKLTGVDIGCSAGYGIAASSGEWNVIITKSILHDNVRAGAYSYSGTKFSIEMSDFNSNSKGLILNSSTLFLRNSSIFENEFGITSSKSEATIELCFFYKNKEAAIVTQNESFFTLKKNYLGVSSQFYNNSEEDDLVYNFPSELHNGKAFYSEKSKFTVDECKIFDSSEFSDDTELSTLSSTFVICHSQDQPGLAILCTGTNIKAEIKKCTFGLVYTDLDKEKTGQSGIGISITALTKKDPSIIQVEDSEFMGLECGILIGNERTCRIYKSTFDSLKQALLVVKKPSEVLVDACVATDSLWAPSGEISKIHFENIDKGSISVGQDGSGNFETIHDALEFAENGSTIHVKKGAYKASFAIKKTVTLVGELTKDGEKPKILWEYEKSDVGIEIESKATLQNLSVICVSDIDHESLDFANDKYYAAINITDNATIENVTIEDSIDDGIIIANNAEPTIEQCCISGCQGYGITVNNASGIVKKCDVHDNKQGGLFVLGNAKPKIESCKIHDNGCAGIEIQDSASGSLSKCNIYGNKQNGLSILGNAKPKIENCKIHDNKTKNEYYPGIVVGDKAAPEIKDCEIFNHLSYGLWEQEHACGTYSNCNIHDNDDAGIEIQDSASGSFSNCVVHNNAANGLLIKGEATPKFCSCRVFDNNGENIHVEKGSSPDIDEDTLFSD